MKEKLGSMFIRWDSDREELLEQKGRASLGREEKGSKRRGHPERGAI